MTFIALMISLFVAAVGALGIAFPAKMLAFARLFDSRSGIWAAAALRVVFGATLYQSAPTSHFPQTLTVLGSVIFIVGLLTPLFSLDFVHRLFAWWEARGLLFMRIWAGAALALALFLLSAIVT